MNFTDVSTILVVEDNGDDVLLIERAFRRLKLANPLQFLDNGDAALDYLSGKPPYDNRDKFPMPALILLDLKLPRRSGFEVLHWIREHPALKVLPVVVLTSSKESADVHRAYQMGANTYLVKPVAFDAFLEMIKTVGLYWFVVSEKPTIGSAAVKKD